MSHLSGEGKALLRSLMILSLAIVLFACPSPNVVDAGKGSLAQVQTLWSLGSVRSKRRPKANYFAKITFATLSERNSSTTKLRQ